MDHLELPGELHVQPGAVKNRQRMLTFTFLIRSLSFTFAFDFASIDAAASFMHAPFAFDFASIDAAVLFMFDFHSIDVGESFPFNIPSI